MLARYGTGLRMAEKAVNAQRAELVIGTDLLVNDSMDFSAGYRVGETVLILRMEKVITANGVF